MAMFSGKLGWPRQKESTAKLGSPTWNRNLHVKKVNLCDKQQYTMKSIEQWHPNHFFAKGARHWTEANPSAQGKKGSRNSFCYLSSYAMDTWFVWVKS